MNLPEYVKRRNGVPIGHPHSLKKNLRRSLGAKNFSSFWNFWNPVFGYYLGVKIFKPLKKSLPVQLALISTFVFCGMIHDLVTTIIRGRVSLFFSVWFLIMGIAVSFARHINYDLSKSRWIARATVNLLIIVTCASLTIVLNRFFKFY